MVHHSSSPRPAIANERSTCTLRPRRTFVCHAVRWQTPSRTSKEPGRTCKRSSKRALEYTPARVKNPARPSAREGSVRPCQDVVFQRRDEVQGHGGGLFGHGIPLKMQVQPVEHDCRQWMHV